MTNSFNFQAAQGDALFMKVERVPDGFSISEPTHDGNHIVAHSETQHNHVMSSKDADMYVSANDNFTAYIVVKNKTNIIHLRGFDTHKPISFNPGIYRVKRQREYTPEGFRKAQD